MFLIDKVMNAHNVMNTYNAMNIQLYTYVSIP